MSKRLGKLVDNGYGNMTLVAIKEMGDELSRLRSYVAAVTPLVEAAREYREADITILFTARGKLLTAALKLEVPRG